MTDYWETNKKFLKENKNVIFLLIIFAVVPMLVNTMMKDSPKKAMKNFVKSYNSGSGHSVVKTTAKDLSGGNDNLIGYMGVRIKNETDLGRIYDDIMNVHNVKILDYKMKKSDDNMYIVKFKLKDMDGNIDKKTCTVSFVKNPRSGKLRLFISGSNLLEYISGVDETYSNTYLD